MKKLLSVLVLCCCFAVTAFAQPATAYINVSKGLIAARPKQVKITTKEGTPNYNAAMHNRALADSLQTYVQWIIKNLVTRVEGDNTAKAIIGDSIVFEAFTDIMNYDVPTDYMLGQPDKPGAAFSLKNRLNAFQADCIEAFGADTALYKSKLSVNVAFTPDPADPETKSWEDHMFYYSPLAITLMHLLKIQNDVRHDEALLADYLNKKPGN